MNLLYHKDEWNIVKGSWEYDANVGSIQDVDAKPLSMVWFGSADGQTPSNQYGAGQFTVEAVIQVHDGGQAGVLFHKEGSNGKKGYWAGLDFGTNQFQVGSSSKPRIGAIQLKIGLG